MSSQIYLKLTGSKQGLISAGCSSYNSIGNKYQDNHTDEIFVYSTNYDISRHQNLSHSPFVMTKPDDKSTPLLLSSISNNEILDCEFFYYRIDSHGILSLYKKIKLTKASIVSISNNHPSSLNHNDMQPYETVCFRYESITCQHIAANTSGYSIKEDSIR
ncbi:Hcp family type VI secretion system effector [Proteus mirabilis]|uniref:Hcp family type VI secretion system effector n=1 Tax=Proteus mirabilis TaxID=584 RepID=UPI00073B9E77|nr:Hcp family type VI secretion system effector [Proteus mirabilis]AVB31806.1 type VI secretion system tube protein Hcp [Proteus mirabilis]EKU7613829.1 Hcp family type VI secretion system effector [Proteus mirabilis]EKX5074576.1 Hcp family type VI secretion system effector [Proteus mirabilis]ELA7738476.1 Hcp family type VI secretion system effector [Proteus mirabilis]ELA7798883.1 Hcp family type VI secretion system effector [Proteus mirabilis]